jgi:hypothetical protein
LLFCTSLEPQKNKTATLFKRIQYPSISVKCSVDTQTQTQHRTVTTFVYHRILTCCFFTAFNKTRWHRSEQTPCLLGTQARYAAQIKRVCVRLRLHARAKLVVRCSNMLGRAACFNHAKPEAQSLLFTCTQAGNQF